MTGRSRVDDGQATEHALDLGPDRVITDLDAEPEPVQVAFRKLIAQTPVALGNENEENESYFLPEYSPVPQREVRRALFMGRLHLALTTEEHAEFVASHLDKISDQFASDFKAQLQAPNYGPEWRMVPGVLGDRPYIVYARVVSDTIVERRR